MAISTQQEYLFDRLVDHLISKNESGSIIDRILDLKKIEISNEFLDRYPNVYNEMIGR